MRDRLVERRLGQPDGRSRDRDPEGGQGLQDHREGLARLPDAGVERDADVGEHDLADDVRRDEVRPRLHPDAGGVGGDEHQRVAVVLLGEDGVEVRGTGVRDEGLVPVQHEFAVALDDAGGDRLQVGADLGLRQAEGGDGVEGHDAGQPLLLDPLTGAHGEGVAADALHGEQRVQVRRHTAEGLADDGDGEGVDLLGGAAVRGRHGQRGQSALLQRLPHHRVDVGGGIGLGGPPADLLPHLAGAALDIAMVVGQLERHPGVLPLGGDPDGTVRSGRRSRRIIAAAIHVISVHGYCVNAHT